MIRRLLPLAGVFFALISTTVRAEASPLTVTGTNRVTGETCWTGTLDTLEHYWGDGPIGDCPGDMVELRVTGRIWLEKNELLATISDDGMRIRIDGQIIYDYWQPRGCWGHAIQTQIAEGWHELEVDWFEDYGGACLHLAAIRNGQLEPILVEPATTTTVSEPITTTTAPEEPTTLPEPSTSLPEPSPTTAEPVQTPSSTNTPSTSATTAAPSQAATTTSIAESVSTSSSVAALETTTIPTTTIVATTQKSKKSITSRTLAPGSSNGLAPGVTPEAQRAIVAATLTMLASPAPTERKRRK